MHFVPALAGVPDALSFVASGFDASDFEASGFEALAPDDDALLSEEDALSAPPLLHAVSARPRATAVMVSAEIFRVRILVSVLCVGAIAAGERRASELGAGCSSVSLSVPGDSQRGCRSCILIVLGTRS